MSDCRARAVEWVGGEVQPSRAATCLCAAACSAPWPLVHRPKKIIHHNVLSLSLSLVNRVWVFIALGIFSSSVAYVAVRRTPVAVKDAALAAMRLPFEAGGLAAPAWLAGAGGAGAGAGGSGVAPGAGEEPWDSGADDPTKPPGWRRPAERPPGGRWEDARWLDADVPGNERVQREGGRVWERRPPGGGLQGTDKTVRRSAARQSWVVVARACRPHP